MAVAFDNADESHTATTPSTSEASFSFNCLAGASARAAWVAAFSLTSATETITAVTYGGVSMTSTGLFATDTLTEPGCVRIWFLDNCGTGTKSVVCTRTNNAVECYAVAFTVTAAGACEIYEAGAVELNDNVTLAQQSVTDGSPGTNSTRFGAAFHGRNAALTIGANSTQSSGIVVATARGAQTCRETTPGQGARNIGWTSGAGDDNASVYFAVRETPVVTTFPYPGRVAQRPRLVGWQ